MARERNKLGQAMETAGVKPAEMAKAVRVSRQAVYMAMRVGPSVEMAHRCAKLLGCDWWALIESPFDRPAVEVAAWNLPEREAVPAKEAVRRDGKYPVRELDDGAD